MTFGDCYCASPLCVPSRAAMLSARLPSSTGIVNNSQALPSHLMTFVHSLSIAGYETVLCGRMHFNGPDQRHGFEQRIMGDLTPSFPGLPKAEQIWGSLLGTQRPSRVSVEKAGAGYSSALQYDSDVADAAARYLADRTDPRPLFLLVGFFGPHCPFVAPPELYHDYRERLPPAAALSDELRKSQHPAMIEWRRIRGVENVSPEQVSRVRAAYYGMVEHVDHQIGRVLGAVESSVGLARTLLVYGSDHGEALGENGLFWKSNFHEGAVKVPLVVSWPSVIAPGTRVDAPVSLMDLGPTLIDLVGAPELPGTDGISLKGVLTGERSADTGRPIFSQLADVKGDRPSRMVRKRNWKLVHHSGYRDVQLFDVAKDPTEKIDRGLDADTRDLIAELVADLDAVCSEERLVRIHEESTRHARMFADWVKAVGQKGIAADEWSGDGRINHVITEP
jgi:choline-sulfatase